MRGRGEGGRGAGHVRPVVLMRGRLVRVRFPRDLRPRHVLGQDRLGELLLRPLEPRLHGVLVRGHAARARLRRRVTLRAAQVLDRHTVDDDRGPLPRDRRLLPAGQGEVQVLGGGLAADRRLRRGACRRRVDGADQQLVGGAGRAGRHRDRVRPRPVLDPELDLAVLVADFAGEGVSGLALHSADRPLARRDSGGCEVHRPVHVDRERLPRHADQRLDDPVPNLGVILDQINRRHHPSNDRGLDRLRQHRHGREVHRDRRGAEAHDAAPRRESTRRTAPDRPRHPAHCQVRGCRNTHQGLLLSSGGCHQPTRDPSGRSRSPSECRSPRPARTPR